MMQIGISGYGKMGKAVERIAQSHGHSIRVLPVRDLEQCDMHGLSCVIDFTSAEAAPDIIRACVDRHVPVVSGTTGWNAVMGSVLDYCRAHRGTVLWAPNFSIGMQIMFFVNRLLARIMAKRAEYDVRISEAHHTEKKDAPSGTAIALAEQILVAISRKKVWQLTDGILADDTGILPVTAERIPGVRGIHDIIYQSPHDVISLKHEALSRDGFALGAVVAAEWLKGRHGVFSFEDVISDLFE